MIKTVTYAVLLMLSAAVHAQSTPPPAQVEENREVLQEGDDLPVVPIERAQQEPLQYAEQMPEFPGGQVAMTNFVSSNIKYPEDLAEAGVGGKVYVEFVVRADGSLTDVRVLRGIPGAPALDREAIRVVKAMPKWIPAKQNGKTVDVMYRLPIMFLAK